MPHIGYAYLIEQLALSVRPLTRPASTSSSVNRRVDSDRSVLFPSNVVLEDSPVGHLEFALRHEGVNLEVIEAAFEKIQAEELIARLRETPNGEHIRRACFLWEWLNHESLPVKLSITAGYVDMFPASEYVTSDRPVRHPRFRVRDNALGTRDFCPTVRRSAVPQSPTFSELLAEAKCTLDTVIDRDFYDRALSYLYLSETRGSYAIEHETPSANKQDRFVQLLRHAGEPVTVTEDWLVSLQNVIVRDVYSQEASYRTKQNWLEDSTGRVTFFPVPQKDLHRAMTGWESFVNNKVACLDALVKAACAAFGFVYLHPFLDGNGRLHRFLIHQILTHSGLLAEGVVVPVSAVISKSIPEYHAVLTAFSKPATALWEYRRGDDEPFITHTASSRAYRFFEADREVSFLHSMIKRAVQEEIPRELAWLKGYDIALKQLDSEFDIPQKDLSALIRMIHSNNGKLSENRRKQFYYLPPEVLARVEEVVRQAFDGRETAESS